MAAPLLRTGKEGQTDNVWRSHGRGLSARSLSGLGRLPASHRRSLLRGRGLELPSIGWQLFILGSSQSDSTAFPSSLDTYATRLLTEPLSSAAVSALERGQRKHPYPHTVRALADALN